MVVTHTNRFPHTPHTGKIFDERFRTPARKKITVLQLSAETVIFKMQVDNWIDILTEDPLYEQLQTKVNDLCYKEIRIVDIFRPQ